MCISVFSKGSQQNNLYTWSEYEAGRGSNEIASTLIHFFKTSIQSNYKKYFLLL